MDFLFFVLNKMAGIIPAGMAGNLIDGSGFGHILRGKWVNLPLSLGKR